MTAKKISLIMVLFYFWGLPIRAQTLLPPDISNWEKLDIVPINIISEIGVIYLGFEQEYQNPSDPSEFVKIAGKFVPFVSISAKLSTQSPYANVANLYLKDEVKKKFESSVKDSDVFLYIRWKTRVDAQTGELIVEGPIVSWLLNTNDVNNKIWFYGAVNSVLVEDISEPNRYNSKQYLTTGRKYRLNGTQHILRVDQDYLVRKEK